MAMFRSACGRIALALVVVAALAAALVASAGSAPARSGAHGSLARTAEALLPNDWIIGTYEVGGIDTNQGSIAIAATSTGDIQGTIVQPVASGLFCRALAPGEVLWRGITYDRVKNQYSGTATVPLSTASGCTSTRTMQVVWAVQGTGVYDISSRIAQFRLYWLFPWTGAGPPVEGKQTGVNFARRLSAAELASPWQKGLWTGTLTGGLLGKSSAPLSFGVGDIGGARDVRWLRFTVPLRCRTYTKTGWSTQGPARRYTITAGKSRAFAGLTVSIHDTTDGVGFGGFGYRADYQPTIAGLVRPGAGTGPTALRMTASWLFDDGNRGFDARGRATGRLAYRETTINASKPLAGQTICNTGDEGWMTWIAGPDRSGTAYVPIR
jgi:hypothetical protein